MSIAHAAVHRAPADHRPGEPRITGEHLELLRANGYAIVDGFLTPDELAAGRENLLLIYPSLEDFEADATRSASLPTLPQLPFPGTALNDMSVHPELISYVSRMLESDDIVLTQSLLMGKYAGTGDFEQQLHRDFHNNTLLIPRDEGSFRQFANILYYTDVTVDLGPTHVVAEPDVPGDIAPWVVAPGSREERPDLYAKEVPITVSAGSLLIYTMHTLHRGSRMAADRGHRWSQHLVYRHRDSAWQGWAAWPYFGPNPDMAALITRITPRQRALFGIPLPGHPYWTDQTIRGVAARYPGMDATPYLEALDEATVTSP
ncbi:MAG: phytanoyl-CoA dioxygenase family protein [Candidatus Dormibacteria bacterium]